MGSRLALLACLVGVACKDEPAKPAAMADPCAKAKPHGTLKWIEDDYASAVACAKQKNLPIVLDMWAPWCHTCLSMQTTVFTDPSLAAEQGKFVFAALDTDREVNAIPVGKFAMSAWPTFYVIGPDEAVLARFVGAASLDQFRDFLAAGARARGGGIAAADARMLGAERALAQKELATADEELTAALASAPPGWPRRAEALGSLQLTKTKRSDAAGCLALSDEHMDAVGQSATATNFWSTAIACADKRKVEEAERATSVRDRAITNLARAIDDVKAPLSVDDRAEAMGYLRDALAATGKKDEANAVAEKLRLHVDDAYAKAATPIAKMTFIWPRAEVYNYLNRQLDLVADFEALAKQLPTEYDPRARLGWLYLKAGKLPEAAKWTDEALALVYGPRKARVLNQRAEIAAGAGDKAAERKYRTEVVKLWESLPPGQQSADSLAKAKEALAKLDEPAAAVAKP